MGTNGSESKLAVAGSIGLILAIAGVVLTQQQLKSSRPLEKPNVMQESVREKTVPARLWEDPLEAVQRAKDGKGVTIDPPYQPRVFDPIRSRIAADPGTVDILLVMTDGGPYAEGKEDRIRDRYAIASALGVSCYVPNDEEHLSYVKWQAGGIPRHLPYEWYRERRTRRCSHDGQRAERVLVLWVTGEILEEQPLQSLARLIGSLCDNPYAGAEQCKGRVGPSQIARIKVIGPRSSSGLREWLKEAVEAVRPIKPAWLTYKNKIELYSPWATAMPSLLMSQLNGGSDPKSTPCESPELCKEQLKWILSDVGIDLKYSIGSDDQLLTALVEELERREVKFGQDAVVLIGEWDTYYGRALPIEFRAAVCYRMAKENRYRDVKNRTVIEKDCESLEKAVQLQVNNQQGYEDLELNIWRYSYLRGLDGQVPGNKEDKSRDNNDQNGGEEKKKKAQLLDDRFLERPIGTSQFDYTRRLADRIAYEMETARTKVRAVGILGTDPYDALLILQALRERFSTAIFFVTDLDARLVYSEDYRWTRNLVIASHFGLTLNDELQRDVPPFRSGYQTSTFFATLQAVGHVRVSETCDRKTSNGTCGYTANLSKNRFYDAEDPRLYEVGRHVPVDLSLQVKEKDRIDGYESLHPTRLDLEKGTPDGLKPNPLRVGAVLALSLITSIAVLLSYRGTRKRALSSPLTGILVAAMLSAAAFLLMVGLTNKTETLAVTVLGLLIFCSCWGLAAAGLWIFPASRALINKVPLPCSIQTGRTTICAFGILLLDGLGYLVVSAVINWLRSGHDQGEPFYWFEGVSIWPTEAIRTVAGILVVSFLMKVSRDLRRNKAEIKQLFGLHPTGGNSPKDNGHEAMVVGEAWLSISLRGYWHKMIAPLLMCSEPVRSGTDNRIDDIWKLYIKTGSWSGRVWTLFILEVVILFLALGAAGGSDLSKPIRGSFGWYVDTIMILLVILSATFLNAFAFDTALHCCLWILAVSKAKGGWPHPTTEQEHLLNKIRLVAKRTEVVNAIVRFPPLVWLLIILARNNYFDQWGYPTHLIVAWTINTLVALAPAFLLYWVGERMRSGVLEDLNALLHRQLRWGESAQNEVEHTREAIRDVETIKKGAFLPLWQQPFVQTLLYGVVALLQYLYLGT